jgi:para-nitrobenzyl esterase
MRGLFNRAIIESGECTHTSTFIQPHQAVVAQGNMLAARLGCNVPATAAACLRSQSAADILSASSGLTVARANVGGPLLPLHPIDAIAQLDFIVPVIIGANHDEQRKGVIGTTGLPGTVQGYQQYLNNAFGASAPLVAAQYPLAAFSDPAYAAGAAASDSGVPSGIGVCPMLVELGGALSRVTQVWEYELDDPDAGAAGPVPAGFQVGSEHGAEGKFLYDLKSIVPATKTPQEQLMGDQMLRYWGAFVRGSVPTDGTLVWPMYNSSQQVLRFQPTGNVLIPTAQVSSEHRCMCWATVGF